MSELSNDDYKKILDFYNENIPKSKRLIKLQAEKILINKLCKCIKKLNTRSEARAIGICTKSVINNKGLKRGKFTCKKRQYITLRKKTLKLRKR
jgi:hypothetical protein